MNKLRVIFFDAVGTLIHLPRGAAFHYREVARRRGLELPEEALAAAFRRVWKETPAPVTTRQPRADDDRGWWEALVHRVLDACAPGEPLSFDRAGYFAELYDEFTKPSVWEPYPETHAVLAELAPRYELGIISNFDRRLHVVLEHLDLARFFRHVIISSEVGADKPDGLIYQRALELSNSPAAAALHVGDDPVKDWEGAAAAGLAVFKLDRPRNSLRDVLAACATI